MNTEKAIEVLERSNRLLAAHMAKVKASLEEATGGTNAPVGFYERLENCQEEYDAVNFAIEVLKEHQKAEKQQQHGPHFGPAQAQRDIVNYLSNLSPCKFSAVGLSKEKVMMDHDFLSAMAHEYLNLVGLNAIKREDACRFVCESRLSPR